MVKKEDKPVEVKEPEPIPTPAPLNADNMTELINKFDEASENLNKANKYAEEIMAKQASIRIENTLGGTAAAGNKKQVNEEERAVERAKQYLSGTGYEDIFDDPPEKPRVKVDDELH